MQVQRNDNYHYNVRLCEQGKESDELGKNCKIAYRVQRVNGSTKANSDLDINAHNAIIMIMIKSFDDNSVCALYIFNIIYTNRATENEKGQQQ